MEEAFVLRDTVLLFDRYSWNSQRLHESFLRAGCECSAVVLEEDDFLPEGVMSVYDMFLGYYEDQGKKLGKPRFFNEVSVPEHWSISAGIGESEYGKITWQHEEKGRIYYQKDLPNKWTVKAVDWLDRKGNVRFRDHYNRYGFICARTVYDKTGKELGKTWFSVSGKEVITENAATSDLIVNDGEVIKSYRTRMDMILYFFRRAGIEQKRVFYNSLSTPFLLSERFPKQEKRDVLFWQEPVRGEIPGNMQIILKGYSSRSARIMVQRRRDYYRLLKLGANPDIIQKLGYLYEFKKENGHRPQALICTNSDQIEHFEELVRALPQMHFHIAALTLMSPALMETGKYDNVTLYPGVKEEDLNKLFMECDYYFDINHWSEIVSAVYRAFLHNQLILAFEETAHNREFVADAHVYPAAAFDRMVSDVRQIMANTKLLKRHLGMQHDDAMVEEKEAYIRLME